jgi:hypothetical protein
MTYYVPDGNWTSAVTSLIGNNQSSLDFSISTGSQDPAPGCLDKTFYASYKCGNETKVRNIPALIKSVGQSVKFDCTDVASKCSNLTLNLGDDGILTVKDENKKTLWSSTSLPNYTEMPTDSALALATYAPEPSNANLDLTTKAPGMYANRSYLNSGEFLTLGQYIGSPSGKCRLEMSGSSSAGAQGIWDLVPSGYTTDKANTLVRLGTTQNWTVRIISTIGTAAPPTTTAANQQWNITAAQGEPWVTIGQDDDRLSIPACTVRYGLNGNFITKTYTGASTNILVGMDEFLPYTFAGNEGSTITVPPNTPVRYGKGDKWAYATMSGSFAANNARFGDPVPGIRKELQTRAISNVSKGTAINPNIVQIQMIANNAMASSGISLQVVYNALGCSDLIPIDSNSASLYTIPWTNRENLGNMGYVNEQGQLKLYPGSMTTPPNYMASFTELANKDGSTYGMYGNDLLDDVANNNPSKFSGLASADDCKTKCTMYGFDTTADTIKAGTPNCVGFEYEKIGKTCQLKGEGVITGGIRRNNPKNKSKDYQYYSRLKGVSGLDPTCSSIAESTTSKNTIEWNTYTKADNMAPTTYNPDGSVLSQGTKCGLENAPGLTGQRAAVAESKANLNKFIDKTSPSYVPQNLYNYYQTLKNYLFENKVKLSDSLTELDKSRQGVEDWSGEQGEQLDALIEDRQLNMESQSYKHIMWSILGILIIIAIIKLVKYLGSGGKIADIVKIPEAISEKVADATAAVTAPAASAAAST